MTYRKIHAARLIKERSHLIFKVNEIDKKQRECPLCLSAPTMILRVD